MADETQKPEAPITLVDRAEAAARKLEEQNKIMEQQLAKMAEMQTRMMLGGRSEAGSAPAPPKEETPQEYRRRVEGGYHGRPSERKV
jgi:type II secretory pathway component PulJ